MNIRFRHQVLINFMHVLCATEQVYYFLFAIKTKVSRSSINVSHMTLFAYLLPNSLFEPRHTTYNAATLV